MNKNFKFLNQDIPVQLPQPMAPMSRRVGAPVRTHVDNEPIVFVTVQRNYRDYEDEVIYLMDDQMVDLIRHMSRMGMVEHTIVSQDENSFVMKTELILPAARTEGTSE